jgi:hypothetical protein
VNIRNYGYQFINWRDHPQGQPISLPGLLTGGVAPEKVSIVTNGTIVVRSKFGSAELGLLSFSIAMIVCGVLFVAPLYARKFTHVGNFDITVICALVLLAVFSLIGALVRVRFVVQRNDADSKCRSNPVVSIHPLRLSCNGHAGASADFYGWCVFISDDENAVCCMTHQNHEACLCHVQKLGLEVDIDGDGLVICSNHSRYFFRSVFDSLLISVRIKRRTVVFNYF